jgi:hypothetical protein
MEKYQQNLENSSWDMVMYSPEEFTIIAKVKRKLKIKAIFLSH